MIESDVWDRGDIARKLLNHLPNRITKRNSSGLRTFSTLEVVSSSSPPDLVTIS